MNDRCDLTDLPRNMCSHCRHLRDPDEPARQPRTGVGPVFPARLPGRCPCGEPVNAGDDIQYVDGELVRVECCGVAR